MGKLMKILPRIIRYYSRVKRDFVTVPSGSDDCIRMSKTLLRKHFTPIGDNCYKWKSDNDKTSIINLSKSKCTCDYYYKDKICAHIVAAKRYFIENKAFITKNKKGAPSKAKKALERD